MEQLDVLLIVDRLVVILRDGVQVHAVLVEDLLLVLQHLLDGEQMFLHVLEAPFCELIMCFIMNFPEFFCQPGLVGVADLRVDLKQTLLEVGLLDQVRRLRLVLEAVRDLDAELFEVHVRLRVPLRLDEEVLEVTRLECDDRPDGKPDDIILLLRLLLHGPPIWVFAL